MSKIDLFQFCGETRNIDRPFIADGKTYATNGHIAIRVNEVRDDFEEAKVSVNFLASAVKAFDVDIKNIKPVKVTGMKNERIDCPQCDGTNKIRCECDCPFCENMVDCYTCNGTGFDYAYTGECSYGNCRFNPKYLHMVQELPNSKMYASKRSNGVSYFTFDGGDGILMGKIT